MRAPAPPLLPILRSRVQGDVLARVYLHPGEQFSVAQLARDVGASPRAVQQEVDRLVASGYLLDRRHGTMRLVRAPETPVTRPLTDLLAVTFGPVPVLTRVLSGLPGVRRAYVYGSWAARHSGDIGPVPRDVDVLVVGDADADDLDDAAHEAEKTLHREVNIRQVREPEWERAGDPFVATMRARPLVELPLGETPAP